MLFMGILSAIISTGFAAEKAPLDFAAEKFPRFFITSFDEDTVKKFMPMKFSQLFDDIVFNMPEKIRNEIFSPDDSMYSLIFQRLLYLDSRPINFISSNYKYNKYDSYIDELYQNLIILEKSLFLFFKRDPFDGDPLDVITPQVALEQALEKLNLIIYFVGKINYFKKATKEIPLLLFKKSIKKLSVDTLKKVSDNFLLDTLKKTTAELSQQTLKIATEKLSPKIFKIATEELPLKLLKIAQEDAMKDRVIVEEAYEDLLPEALKGNPHELPLQILLETICEYNKQYPQK